MPVYSTKPAGTYTKQGTSGKKVELCANYFRLIKKPSFEFNLYRVDFEPPVDEDKLRKAFISQQRAVLGGYLTTART